MVYAPHGSFRPVDGFAKQVRRVILFRRLATVTLVSTIFISVGTRLGFAETGHVDFCAERPASMVAWWPLDEASGGIAEDIVGGNDGAYTNGPTPISGEVAGAYQFDGINDYVNVPNAVALNFGDSTGHAAGDLSIDAWIRSTSTTGIRVILDKRTFTPTRGYSLYLLDGKLGFQLADAGGPGDTCGGSSADPCRNYDSGIVVATGNWVHVAVTVDRDNPSGLRFYVNGAPTGSVFDPTTKQGSLTNTAPLSLARRSDATSYFPGSMDEVEIFDRALTPEEIATVHGAGPRGKCKCIDRPAGLVSWWPADDCLAADRVGPNNGVFFGNPTCPSDPKVGGGAWGGLGPAAPTYIEVPHDASLNFGLGDLSIDGWIRTSDPDAPIVSKGGPLGRLYTLTVTGGKLRFDACDLQQCSTVESAGTVNSGSWRFIGVTLHRTGVVSPGISSIVVTLYVNGLPDGIAGWTLGDLDSTADLLIGAGGSPSSPDGFFDGWMDELEIFNRALGAGEMKALHDVDRYGKCKCEEPPPGMTAWWPFDETSGTTANEIVGNHLGTYGGSPIPVPGLVAGALDFNGGADKVTVAHDPTLNFGTGDLTIDFWAYNESGLTNYHNSFIEKPSQPPFNPGMWGVRYEGSGGAHLHVEGTAPFLGVVLPSDQWKHVAITFEQGVPGVIKGYLNGVLKGTRNPPGPGVYNMTTTTPITIGNSTSGWGPTGLKAQLDELELFNRALDQSEILGIVRAGSYGKCKTTRIPRTTDIRVEKTVDVQNPAAGSTVTFQVTITNLGPDPVKTVIVRDQFPPGLVPLSYTIAGGGTYNKYSGQLIIPVIAAQASAVLTVVARVDTCSFVANCASFIIAGTPDGNPLNDVSCAQITPQSPCAEIHGTKYYDFDRNGTRDLGEQPIQGQTIVWSDGIGQSSTSVTGASGDFSFLPLAPGTYKLTEIMKPNQIMISPPNGSKSIVLTPGGQSFGNDFGNYLCPPGDAGCLAPPTDMVEWWPFDSIQSGTAGCAYTAGLVRGAHDRVFGSPVGASTCGTTSPGRWNGGITFDGIDDYVEAQDHPSLNFGPAVNGTKAGDFSIDAWIKTTSLGLQIIVDKRREDTPGGVQGYSLYTFNGTWWLQLASSAGVSNYNSGSVINDGSWHHITVTVDRDSSSGIHFYTDGAAGITANPTLHMGTLANPMPLRIGRRSDSSSPGFFTGGIDEVEIFRRVLTPDEIHDLATRLKCKSEVPHVPKSVPVCISRPSVAMPITLCNWQGTQGKIRWSLAGLPVSSGCSVAGPVSFSPTAGITQLLDPGACETVVITMPRPANLGAGDTSCFQLTANGANGYCSSAFGALVGDPGYCVSVDPYDGVVEVVAGSGPGGGGTPVHFDVSNDSPSSALNYRIRVVPSAVDGSLNEVVSLEGQPPGAPVEGFLIVPPGEETTITANVSYVEQDSLRFYDLLLEADTDGDGQMEPLSSIGLRSIGEGSSSTSCPGPTPPESIVLQWSSKTRLAWTGSACAALYSVYRHEGALTDADRDGIADDYGHCYGLRLPEAELYDVSVPPIGTYQSYLVAAVTAFGENPLGNASAGPRPTRDPCP